MPASAVCVLLLCLRAWCARSVYTGVVVMRSPAHRRQRDAVYAALRRGARRSDCQHGAFHRGGLVLHSVGGAGFEPGTGLISSASPVILVRKHAISAVFTFQENRL